MSYSKSTFHQIMKNRVFKRAYYGILVIAILFGVQILSKKIVVNYKQCLGYVANSIASRT